MLPRPSVFAIVLLLVLSLCLTVPGCGSSGVATDDGMAANIKAADATGPPEVALTGAAALSTSTRRTGSLPHGSGAGVGGINLHPLVQVTTSAGEIVLRLDRKKAPRTVENFLEYVDREHYEQTIFHCVDQGFIVLGGGFTADHQPKETRAEIISEAHNGMKNLQGTIAMARDWQFAHSATCQFFFNLADNHALDHKGRESAAEYGYCVFGKIVKGLDVVDRIAAVKVRDTDQFAKLPVEPVVIESIKRVDRGAVTE